jgi:trimethylamine--corrinoid protein Co-methyltransferase
MRDKEGDPVMSVKIQIFSEPEKKKIHQFTMELLGSSGIRVEKASIRELLLKNGATDAGEDRILLQESMIMEAISRAPSSFFLYGSDGTAYPVGGGGRPLVSSCMVDPVMNSRGGNRAPVLADCSRNARIIGGEPMIDIPYKMDLTYADLAEEDCVAQSNYAVLSNMTKPFINGPQTKRDMDITIEMAAIMACGPLSEKPNLMTLISPSSPLTLHEDCLDMLESAVFSGVPVICLPCPMNGLTSPVSVIGTILTVNAENLALITIIQLLRPGSKVIYHTVAMPADARTLEARMTGPEKMLDAIGAAEMGRFYGLPVGLPISSTEVSGFDIQNGAESMSQIFPGILFSPDIVSGVGSNTNACGTSIEQILLDCEMIRLASRFQRGVAFGDLEKSFQTIERVGPGGSYINDWDTLDDFRNEDIFIPELFRWTGHPDFEVSAVEKAAAKAESLALMPVAVDSERLALLQEYIAKKVPCI